MKLGNLDRYIVIETYTETADAYGEKVKTWATHHSCFANMATASGGESVTAEQITDKLNVNWTIHYKSGITAKMRVNYDSDYYQITAILEEGRNKRLILQSYRL